MSKEEVPLMKLSLELHPEAIPPLLDFTKRLQAMESELQEIRTSLAESLGKFFKITERPPSLGEAVVSELDPGAAPAGD